MGDDRLEVLGRSKIQIDVFCVALMLATVDAGINRGFKQAERNRSVIH